MKIILADDHDIIREGLRTILDKETSLTVVAEADNGRDLLPLIEKEKPDMIIMDVAMPELNGIDATREVLRVNPRLKVIGLSMHADRRFASEMLRAGASGYILKNRAAKELIKAIKSVREGNVYLSPEILGMLIGEFVKSPPSDSNVFQVLSERERAVMQLLAEGKNTKEIAGLLDISTKTVESHRVNIMGKLNLTSIAELTKCAIREGLTSI